VPDRPRPPRAAAEPPRVRGLLHARRKRRQRWLVRMDPELRRDVELHDACDRRARFAYIDSLFYLASGDGPDGLYPAGEVAREFGSEAAEVTAQLLTFGLWTDAALGFLVTPYAGWRVIPDQRLPIRSEVRLAVYERDGWRCVNCGSGDDLTLDHITPWILGGSDGAENLQTMCRPCNCRKGARVLCPCRGCGSTPHSP
jgi:HNH endonuclease